MSVSPTIEKLINTSEAERAGAATRRREARQAIEGLIARAAAENREHLTPAESAIADRMLGQRDEAARQIGALDAQLVELRAAQADELANFARTQMRRPGPDMPHPAQMGYDRQARIGQE